MMDSVNLVKRYQATHYEDDGSTEAEEETGYASDTVTCPVAMGKGVRSLMTHLKQR
jgi:hypothetical protein